MLTDTARLIVQSVNIQGDYKENNLYLFYVSSIQSNTQSNILHSCTFEGAALLLAWWQLRAKWRSASHIKQSVIIV